jgi:hypothetical protein
VAPHYSSWKYPRLRQGWAQEKLAFSKSQGLGRMKRVHEEW